MRLDLDSPTRQPQHDTANARFTPEPEPTQLSRALPHAESAPATGGSGPEGFTVPSTSWSQRVLVVDDDDTIRDVVRLMLRHLDYTPDVACNGVEALAAASAAIYDVIFMDVQMPEMDGIEATRRIRSFSHPTRQPVIVAMTANSRPEDQAACLEAGMDYFVPKPVRLRALTAALGSVSSGIRPATDLGSSVVPEILSEAAGPLTVRPSGSEAQGPRIYDSAPLDELVDNLGENGKQMRNDLIETYISEGPKTLAALASASRDASGKALERFAHKHKASSAALGLDALTSVARDIEAALQSAPDRVDVSYEAERLAAELHRATSALHLVLAGDNDLASSIDHAGEPLS
jgi:CheY-like chemotaxis protein